MSKSAVGIIIVFAEDSLLPVYISRVDQEIVATFNIFHVEILTIHVIVTDQLAQFARFQISNVKLYQVNIQSDISKPVRLDGIVSNINVLFELLGQLFP
jgi:hypothetical protein